MPDVRATMAKLMNATVADAAYWTYREIRPISVPTSWKPSQLVTADCSKGAQMLCRWAGAPDPMNNAFGPYGNSQTICLALQHLASPSLLQVGDPVTFGHNGDQHAALTLEPGPDPLLWSFGHQGAPNTYRLSQDGREYQCLLLSVAAYIPTPADGLRAKTGWFSWVAWRLGEGDWKQYGKANKHVRPNVPVAIPADWWLHYIQFMKNRSKGNKPTTK